MGAATQPNPRQKFANWLAGRDPTQVEQLIEDLHAVSDDAFLELCGFAGALASAANPQGVVAAARDEVLAQPQRAGGKRKPLT
jgi:hypothetical protein